MAECIRRFVSNWMRKQHGQGLVEYALILVLISIVAIAIMTTVGGSINNIFQVASNTLTNP